MINSQNIFTRLTCPIGPAVMWKRTVRCRFYTNRCKKARISTITHGIFHEKPTSQGETHIHTRKKLPGTPTHKHTKNTHPLSLSQDSVPTWLTATKTFPTYLLNMNETSRSRMSPLIQLGLQLLHESRGVLLRQRAQ
jgi:hypothetical protein